MTAKEIEKALVQMKVCQSGYAQDKDILKVDGDPVAFIGIRGKYDQWWPALRTKIAQHLASTLDTPVADRYAQERGFHPSTREVLAYLNTRCGRAFRETDANLKVISARLKEQGVDVEGVRLMIDRMCDKWGADDKMREYLRPETLFRASKFDSYYQLRNDSPVGGRKTALRGTNI